MSFATVTRVVLLLGWPLLLSTVTGTEGDSTTADHRDFSALYRWFHDHRELVEKSVTSLPENKDEMKSEQMSITRNLSAMWQMHQLLHSSHPDQPSSTQHFWDEAKQKQRELEKAEQVLDSNHESILKDMKEQLRNRIHDISTKVDCLLTRIFAEEALFTLEGLSVDGFRRVLIAEQVLSEQLSRIDPEDSDEHSNQIRLSLFSKISENYDKKQLYLAKMRFYVMKKMDDLLYLNPNYHHSSSLLNPFSQPWRVSDLLKTSLKEINTIELTSNVEIEINDGSTQKDNKDEYLCILQQKFSVDFRNTFILSHRKLMETICSLLDGTSENHTTEIKNQVRNAISLMRDVVNDELTLMDNNQFNQKREQNQGLMPERIDIKMLDQLLNQQHSSGVWSMSVLILMFEEYSTPSVMTLMGLLNHIIFPCSLQSKPFFKLDRVDQLKQLVTKQPMLVASFVIRLKLNQQYSSEKHRWNLQEMIDELIHFAEQEYDLYFTAGDDLRCSQAQSLAQIAVTLIQHA